MKVYVKPQQQLSRAMLRVSDALAKYAPSDVTIIDDNPSAADVQILHNVGSGEDCLRKLQAPQYVTIQYCYDTAGGPGGKTHIHSMWKDSRNLMVWSYLKAVADNYNGNKLYYWPLGIAEEFTKPFEPCARTISIVTTGYVDDSVGEPIGEVARACKDSLVVHVGPRFPDLESKKWVSVEGVKDVTLADLYRNSMWVSAMRHGEGFEFSAVEGLACGARPICFDYYDMRHWYEDRVVYVKDCHGEELEEQLREIISAEPLPVTREEREKVLEMFSWERIVEGFWKELMR